MTTVGSGSPTGAPSDVNRRSASGSGPSDRPPEPGWMGTLVAGTILVAWTLIAAILIRYHPEANGLDRWGLSLVPPDPHNSVLIRIAGLKAVVIAGGSVLAAVVVVTRDRARALACLISPALAVFLVEALLKPVIARRFEAVLTFPSGTVTAVAAVAAAWAIAVPRWLRWPVIVLGALAVTLECRAVIALQWHLPSDALAGAVFGVGVVLLTDGLLHLGQTWLIPKDPPGGHVL